MSQDEVTRARDSCDTECDLDKEFIHSLSLTNSSAFHKLSYFQQLQFSDHSPDVKVAANIQCSGISKFQHFGKNRDKQHFTIFTNRREQGNNPK